MAELSLIRLMTMTKSSNVAIISRIFFVSTARLIGGTVEVAGGMAHTVGAFEGRAEATGVMAHTVGAVRGNA